MKIKKYITHNKGVFLIFSNLITPFAIKFFLYTGITANQISIFNLLFVIIPFSLIAFGNYWVVVLGCFLLQTHIILDYADGAIARIKKTNSIFGNYYEGLFHDNVPPVLILALSINSYMFFNKPVFLFLGGLTAFFMMFIQHLNLSKDSIALTYSSKTKKLLNPAKKNLHKTVEAFTSYSRFLGILLIFAIFNVIQYAIIFYSLLYFFVAVVKFCTELENGFKKYDFK